jgi:hypothetical protein
LQAAIASDTVAQRPVAAVLHAPNATVHVHWSP